MRSSGHSSLLDPLRIRTLEVLGVIRLSLSFICVWLGESAYVRWSHLLQLFLINVVLTYHLCNQHDHDVMPSGTSKEEIIKKSGLQSSILLQSQTLGSKCGNFQNVVNDAGLWVGNTEPRLEGHKLEDSQLPEGLGAKLSSAP
jgi:hypothetical protein